VHTAGPEWSIQRLEWQWQWMDRSEHARLLRAAPISRWLYIAGATKFEEFPTTSCWTEYKGVVSAILFKLLFLVLFWKLFLSFFYFCCGKVNLNTIQEEKVATCRSFENHKLLFKPRTDIYNIISRHSGCALNTHKDLWHGRISKTIKTL